MREKNRFEKIDLRNRFSRNKGGGTTFCQNCHGDASPKVKSPGSKRSTVLKFACNT